MSAQNMSEGFELLENQEYAEAEAFFEDVLKNFPKNLTANICYGRAVGLGGKPSEALSYFQSISSAFSGEHELSLNIAEAYLWNKKPQLAIDIYNGFEAPESNAYPTLIGLTNAYAQLKAYPRAIATVKHAIASYPQHESSHQLLESLQLAYADQLIQTDRFKLAKDQYDIVLDNNPQSVPALIGMTNVSYLLDQNKECLPYAQLGVAYSVQHKTLEKEARANLVQAFIWNHRYKEAIDLLETYFNTEPDYQGRYRARMNIQRQEYVEANSHYEQLIYKDRQDIEAWAGKTNALIAMDSIIPAINIIKDGTLSVKGDPNLNRIKIKTQRLLAPKMHLDSKYSFDSGMDESFDVNLLSETPISQGSSMIINGGYRFLNNDILSNSLSLFRINGGLSYKIFSHTYAKVNIGLTQIDDASNEPTLITYDIGGQTKINRHQIKLAFRRSLQNYNFSLVRERLSQRQLFAEYNYNGIRGYGFFSQFVQSNLSDGNNSSLFYGALYKSVKRRPFIKLGASLQLIRFSEFENRPYFSPELFVAPEIFVDILRTPDLLKEKGITYLLTGAGGFQFISDGDTGLSYRLQLRAGYLFKSGFHIEAYGLRTNVASSNASGFTFNQLGVSAKMFLKQSPLFKVN